jgi:hypothetical protein
VVALDDVVALAVTSEQLARELGLASWLGTLVTALAGRFFEADQDRVRLRGELRRAEIANACLEHLVRDGVDTVNGREAPWSPLASRLAGQFASEQGELTAIVSAMAGFRLNVARDVIAMPPHRFAG